MKENKKEESKLNIVVNGREFDLKKAEFIFPEQGIVEVFIKGIGDGTVMCGIVENILNEEGQEIIGQIIMGEAIYKKLRPHKKQLCLYPAGRVLEREGNMIKKFAIDSVSIGVKKNRLDFARESFFPPGENIHTCGQEVLSSSPMTRHQFYKSMEKDFSEILDAPGYCVLVGGGVFWYDEPTYKQLFKEEEKPKEKKEEEKPNCPTCGNNLDVESFGIGYTCGWCGEWFPG